MKQKIYWSIITGNLHFGEGEITFFQQRAQMVLASLFSHMLKNAKDQKKEERSQYLAMKKAAFHDFSKIKKVIGQRNDLLEILKNYVEISGFGKSIIERSQVEKGRFVWTIKNSAIADEYLKHYGKSSTPVCHALRGLLVGGISAVLSREDLDGVETHCMAKGDQMCRFVVRPTTEFKRK